MFTQLRRWHTFTLSHVSSVDSASHCIILMMYCTSPGVVPMFVCLFSWQQLAPHVRVWDSVSLNTLHVLGTGFFDRALVCLAFSKSVRKPLTRPFLTCFWLFSGSWIPFFWAHKYGFVSFSVCENGGNTLCVVDDSNDHVLSVWDWQREDRLAEVKVC